MTLQEAKELLLLDLTEGGASIPTEVREVLESRSTTIEQVKSVLLSWDKEIIDTIDDAFSLIN